MTVTVLRPREDFGRDPTVPRDRTAMVTAAWLVLICAILTVASWRPGSNANSFQDEGLYLFMGHRMIDHVVDGVHVSEYPGSYFSGAPGLYPVLGALADSVGGLPAARMLSSVFVWAAVVAVYRVGRDLYGRTAGLIAAGAFAVNGSVVFVSHLATFDAMALALLAWATALTTRSAGGGRFFAAPAVGLLLAVAFFTKYASALYVPGIALIGVLLVWPVLRWGALRRGLAVVVAAAAVAFFVITFWAPDLMGGIESTTTDRTPISPAGAGEMLSSVQTWAGPWIASAALGVVAAVWVGPRALGLTRWPLAILLFVMSIIGPVQQIRMHESTSLGKHLAFGMIFAAPLIGVLGAALLTRVRWVGAPLVALIAVWLLFSGLVQSQRFLTTWVDDSALLTQLRTDLPRVPGKAVLGEEPSAQRYALRDDVDPVLWTDTFSFGYGGLTGIDAYLQAVDQSHFGIVYLTLNTTNGRLVNDYLTTADTPYRLSAKVPFERGGDFAGYYLVWTPKVLET